MGQATVHDAITAKLAALAATVVAYGDGTTDPTISPRPQSIVTMPAVVVRQGDDARTMGLQRELWISQWEADFYLPVAGGPGLAVQKVNTLRDQLRVEFRLGVQLGGLVSVLRYLGSSAPAEHAEGEDEAKIAYFVLTARFESQERIPVSVTM